MNLSEVHTSAALSTFTRLGRGHPFQFQNAVAAPRKPRPPPPRPRIRHCLYLRLACPGHSLSGTVTCRDWLCSLGIACPRFGLHAGRRGLVPVFVLIPFSRFQNVSQSPPTSPGAPARGFGLRGPGPGDPTPGVGPHLAFSAKGRSPRENRASRRRHRSLGACGPSVLRSSPRVRTSPTPTLSPADLGSPALCPSPAA